MKNSFNPLGPVITLLDIYNLKHHTSCTFGYENTRSIDPAQRVKICPTQSRSAHGTYQKQDLSDSTLKADLDATFTLGSYEAVTAVQGF